MKKLILSITILSFLAVNMFAQGDPKKAFKIARKDLQAYQSNPLNNYDKLVEAVKYIDFAAEKLPTPESSLLKGKIYNELADAPTIFAMSEAHASSFTNNYPEAAITAYEALSDGIDKSTKKAVTNEISAELMKTAGYLDGLGLDAYRLGDFNKAMTLFKDVMNVGEMIGAHGGKNPFGEGDNLNGILLKTSLAAVGAGDLATAKPLLHQLKDNGYSDAAMYQALYNVTKHDDETAALALLSEGRAKYPDDQGLLYDEINAYINAGRMNELVDKLEVAIGKDPNNKTLYSTMGSVYDKLYQDEFEAGDSDKAQGYFDNAKDYYLLAVEKDGSYFDPVYSVGVLYFNRGALEYNKINDEFGSDFSKAGINKFEKEKARITELYFNQALPYFKKAEIIDPNDTENLKALRELYARMDDVEMSKEFDKRLQTVKGGGRVQSYFGK